MIAETLKQETRDFHIMLERRLSRVLFSPSLSPSVYFQVLHAFFFAYKELESAVVRYGAIRQLMMKRSKLNNLQMDLNNLALTYPISGKSTTCDTALEITSLSQAYGAMYVMEGATLGGQIIVPQLNKHSWVKNCDCLNFFNSYGEKKQAMWASFMKVLDNHAKKEDETAVDICFGSRQAFFYLHSKLFA